MWQAMIQPDYLLPVYKLRVNIVQQAKLKTKTQLAIQIMGVFFPGILVI